MAFVVVAFVALALGAGDQYLGTLAAAHVLGWWSVSFSALSAPWLVLPFVAGSRQREPWRATLVGEVTIWAALLGYFAMTMSPMEGAHIQVWEMVGFVRSNWAIEVGGLTLGPVFGCLGYRWTSHRSPLAATVVVGVLCLEPVAVVAVGRGAGRSVGVWVAEAVAGLVLAAWFLSSSVGRHRNLV